MRALSRIMVLALAVLAASALNGLVPRQVSADGPSAASATSLTMSEPQAGKDPGTLLVSARLVDAGGESLEGERIDFVVDVDFPGAKPLLVGSKTTDATGTATILYRPSWDGTHTITARSRGSRSYSAAASEISFEASSAVETYVEATRALEALRSRLPLTVGAVVVFVWIALAFIAVRTVAGIVRAGAANSQGTAHAFLNGPPTDGAGVRAGETALKR